MERDTASTCRSRSHPKRTNRLAPDRQLKEGSKRNPDKKVDIRIEPEPRTDSDPQGNE
jgi:hypothetical protein